MFASLYTSAHMGFWTFLIQYAVVNFITLILDESNQY